MKREINEEMKNFAENTMNELLGWYGYDKVELKDGEDIEFRSYTTDGESRQHISVLKENSLPKPKLPEDSVISSYNISTGYSGLATGNGLSDSPAGSKDHGNVPIIVPLIPPPFIKPPAGTLAPRVHCMERGRGANHVMPSSDTSWSAHHLPLAKTQANNTASGH